MIVVSGRLNLPKNVRKHFQGQKKVLVLSVYPWKKYFVWTRTIMADSFDDQQFQGDANRDLSPPPLITDNVSIR